MCFAFFFIYTGFYKVLNVEAFRFNLARTAVFPEFLLPVLPYMIIGLEFFIEYLLFFKPNVGVKVFAFTMLIFSAYISVLFYYGRYEVCGCGGILNGLEFKYHLIINLVFALLAFVVIRIQKNNKS